MPYARTAAGRTLHYRIDNFTDPWMDVGTIILQHGYARSSRFWHGWVPHLARHYRVVRPDLRGHGASPVDFDPASGSLLADYVADILALLDELQVDAVHYCGESFGGVIGMVLAADHPGRVRTLSMVSAPVYQNQKSQTVYAAGFPTREEALRTLGTRRWAEVIYGAPDFFPQGTDPGLRRWYVGEIGQTDAEVLCGLNGLLRHADVREYLPRIHAPVLSLYPTSGLLTGSEQEALLAAGITNLRMVHLPTSSHAVLTLYPAECAHHVRAFIAAHDCPPSAA